MSRKCINLKQEVVISKFNKVKGLLQAERANKTLRDEDAIERLLDVWLATSKKERGKVA